MIIIIIIIHRQAAELLPNVSDFDDAEFFLGNYYHKYYHSDLFYNTIIIRIYYST